MGIFCSGNNNNTSELLIVLASCFAAWEMLEEGYVFIKKTSCYTLHYKGVTIVPRLAFWSVMATLALAGWIIALV